MRYIKSALIIVSVLFCSISVMGETFSVCYLLPESYTSQEYLNDKNYWDNHTYKIIVDDAKKTIEFRKSNKVISTFRIKTKKRGSKNQTIYTAANKETGNQITMEVYFYAGSSAEFAIFVTPIKNVSSAFKGKTAEFQCSFDDYDD